MKNQGDYNDSYVQSEAMLLYIIFETSKYILIKTYDLDSIHLYSLFEESWTEVLKKIQIGLNSSRFNIYFYKKNLHGKAMCEKLRIYRIKWNGKSHFG